MSLVFILIMSMLVSSMSFVHRYVIRNAARSFNRHQSLLSLRHLPAMLQLKYASPMNRAMSSTVLIDVDSSSSSASNSQVDFFNLELPTNANCPNLVKIRHSTSHIMAMAVQKLFPKAQVTIGPWIDDG